MKTGFKGLALRIKIFILGILATVGGLITQFSMCSRQAVVVTTQIVSNPANQLAATEFASFAANMMYEGTDDPFPTAGIGGELGKILRKFPKAFKNNLINILIDANNRKAGKNLIVKINGNETDCIKKFDKLINSISKDKIKKTYFHNDKKIKTYIYYDNTFITLRNKDFSSEAMHTIEIGNKSTKKLKEGQKLKIKFLN